MVGEGAGVGVNHKYRADIDGLRAVAILCVVGFHAFPHGLAGGFIGVDIFFVISGFLITTILLESLARGDFSFIAFYARRIRRIFPALIAVFAFSIIFGWFFLLPYEYKQLGKHMAGAAVFASNFMLWNESGYFDTLAEAKPFLHLWSLGVEEQFYIFYPLALWLAWKRRFSLLAVTALIMLVSFGVNMWTYKADPVADFYSPLTRVWELMLGSTVAYMLLYPPGCLAALARKREQMAHARDIQSFLGAALLGMGLAFITKEQLFPGWRALLPTIGAALLISAGTQAWVNRLLSKRVFVWVGLVSFPLYVWHWTLLSFARIVYTKTPPPDIRLAVVLLSFFLAWLTYRFIEKPIRYGKHHTKKTIALSLLLAVLGCVGYAIYAKNGMETRAWVADTALVKLNPDAEGEYVWSEITKLDLQPFAKNQKKKILVIGDSFSGDIINAIEESPYADNVQVRALVIRAGCGNLFVEEDFSRHLSEKKKAECNPFEGYKNPRYMEIIAHADVIFLASMWQPWELEYLQRAVNNFSGVTKARVLVFGSKSLRDGDVRELLKIPQHDRGKLRYAADQTTLGLNQAIQQTVGENRYVDVERLFCGAHYACPLFDENLLLLSQDGSHLTHAGAQYLGKRLADAPLLQYIFEQ